jgi:hypothetical protein
MIDLQQDIAPVIQIYDSSAVVAYKIALRVDIACLLVQPNTFGTSYVAADRHPLTEAMRPLREHLLLYYPPDHELTYVTSATAPGRNAILSRFPLKNLGGTEEAPQVPGGSLFIPPASPLQADDQFVSKMFDTRRLTEMYRSRKNNGNQDF